MDGTKTIKLFTLDACCVPTPCEDPQAHAAWMLEPSNSTILESKIPKTRHIVRTVFLGQNLGTDDAPVFFDVRIEPLVGKLNLSTGQRFIVYAQCPDSNHALLQHDRAIAFARRMDL